MLHIYLRQSEDAYGLLADALALHGSSPLPAISRTQEGKPFFPEMPLLHFNISHTKGWSLCAISNKPVGVDIEVLRPRREGLFRYCLTETEYERFDGTWQDFYRIWTLKEAWCKYLGQPGRHPKHWPTPPPFPHRSWLTDEFAASVCGEDPLPDWIIL